MLVLMLMLVGRDAERRDAPLGRDGARRRTDFHARACAFGPTRNHLRKKREIGKCHIGM